MFEQIKKIISDNFSPIQKRIKKIFIVYSIKALFSFVIALPLIYFGSAFLIMAIFFAFSNLAGLAIAAVYTGLICLGGGLVFVVISAFIRPPKS